MLRSGSKKNRNIFVLTRDDLFCLVKPYFDSPFSISQFSALRAFSATVLVGLQSTNRPQRTVCSSSFGSLTVRSASVDSRLVVLPTVNSKSIVNNVGSSSTGRTSHFDLLRSGSDAAIINWIVIYRPGILMRCTLFLWCSKSSVYKCKLHFGWYWLT